MRRPRVSVVIPNYNGEKYIKNCIDSIMNQSVNNYEVIVVDDASTDNSMDWIANTYPEVRCIYHTENAGFCKSVNDGIKVAKAAYIILLNNDTIVDHNFVFKMYKAIIKNKKTFSVSARMIAMDNHKIMDDAGDYYCVLGWAFAPAKDKACDKFNSRQEIFSACGGAAIYRKAVLDKIGLFDENHFAYLEDVDIGYRAGLYGYKNFYEPEAIVIHAGSASSGSRYNEFKAKLTARNNLYLIYKNMPNWQLVLNAPWLVIGTFVKLAFYWKKGLFKAYWQGIKDGFVLIKNQGNKNRVDFEAAGISNCLRMELILWINLIRRFCNVNL